MRAKIFSNLRTTLFIWTSTFALLPTYFISDYLIEEFRAIQTDEQIKKLKLQNLNVSQSVEFELQLLNSHLQQTSLDADVVLSAYTGAFGQKARTKLNQLTSKNPMLSTVMLIDKSMWIAEASPSKAELININPLIDILNKFSVQLKTQPNVTTTIVSAQFSDELRDKGSSFPQKISQKSPAKSGHVLVYIYPLIFTDSHRIETGYLVGLVSIERIYENWQNKLSESQLVKLSLENKDIITIIQKSNIPTIQVKENLHINPQSVNNDSNKLIIQASVERDKNKALMTVNTFINKFKIITAVILLLILITNTIIIRKLINLFNKLTAVIQNYASGDLTPDTPDLFFIDLNQIISVLATMAKRILENQQELEQRVEGRTNDLQNAYDDLYKSNDQLKAMQAQLIEAEKMSLLGQLVAGVAHEINTPIGISVTATTALMDRIEQLEQNLQKGKLTKSVMNNNLKLIHECSNLIYSNLKRAAELIKNFKEVAVDQSIESQRKFNLYNYLQDVLISLKPELRQYQVDVNITGEKDFELTNDPGAFGQIITNFVINSLKHAFSKQHAHAILIYFTFDNNDLTLTYQDDGEGLTTDQLDKIFEPFYTTKRGEGGTGLGLHIVYNLVTQRLKGSIKCFSEPSKGVKFTIKIPLKYPLSCTS